MYVRTTGMTRRRTGSEENWKEQKETERKNGRVLQNCLRVVGRIEVRDPTVMTRGFLGATIYKCRPTTTQ